MGKLYLLTGDYILNSKEKDAIVNATNKYMTNGSGICGVIYRNAGFRLEEYCHNTYTTNMVNNEVRITPGFDLNMDITEFQWTKLRHTVALRKKHNTAILIVKTH